MGLIGNWGGLPLKKCVKKIHSWNVKKENLSDLASGK
jgi:hypothetical protein